MFYAVTLNCLLLEIIFHILVYDSPKKEASTSQNVSIRLPTLPMEKKI